VIRPRVIGEFDLDPALLADGGAQGWIAAVMAAWSGEPVGTRWPADRFSSCSKLTELSITSKL